MNKRTFNVTGGKTLRCKHWRAEGLLRLLENVLAVGEDPNKLIVYAALGRAARSWSAHDAIVKALTTITEDETLIVQSGKPIGVLKTHADAPIVVMANCNLIGQWAKAENFYDLEAKGLTCWGGLTAGDWQYIGSQGVIQGTYEIFSRIAERHFQGSLAGRFILTAGLGGMGGAQPLAGRMAKAAILVVDVDAKRIEKRMSIGYLEKTTDNLDEALKWINQAQENKTPLSVGLLGNAATVYSEIFNRGIIPDIVTDQTAAHDLVYGYVPEGYSLEDVIASREKNRSKLMHDARTSIVRHVEAMLGFQDNGAVVFDNGNLIRTQAHQGGVTRAFNIPVFTEAFLRPLFARAIGPFRWIALSNNPEDIVHIDKLLINMFPDNSIITNWINLASQYVPIEGLPARIAWLGHQERSALALEINRRVADGRISAPVAFTRDHLDAGAMAHPNIMTENMKDGSDAIADWPLINAMLACSSGADLVAIHSGGGGYSGYMTSSGLTIIADGSETAAKRLVRTEDNDTASGILRYADAGYEESLDAVKSQNIHHINC